MNNFKEVTHFVVKAFNLCNWKINIYPCRGIKFVFFGNRLGYIDDNKIFYFRIVNTELNDSIKTQMLDIIAHELSHLNQKVDYNKYNSDINYMKQIEKENIDNTYNFIINNKNLFEKELNFKIDMNYMNMMKELF